MLLAQLQLETCVSLSETQGYPNCGESWLGDAQEAMGCGASGSKADGP
jgi:hypothetical protein